MTTATTTRRPNAKQREILVEAIAAADEAKEIAAALREAEKARKAAESEAIAVLRQIGGAVRLKDETGDLRKISIDESRKFTASGTREDRVAFATAHRLKTTAPDCATGTLKTMAAAAIAAGLLRPVPTIAID